MDKNKIHTTINSALILAILVFGMAYYLANKQEQIVYVDHVRLFNGFHMTQDFQAAEKQNINKQQKELDSLYTIFKSIKDANETLYKNIQQQIALKRKAYQELQDAFSHHLNTKVWSRLNNYIGDYAKENNLKLVLGANSNGNVMFGEKTIDVTNDLLRFANARYEGNN